MSTTDKGKVFGGTARLPFSPYADMHGMVRCIIRTKLFSEAIDAMRRLGVQLIPQDLGRSWSISVSAVEAEVTARAYGEIFACPLPVAYLRPESYILHRPTRATEHTPPPPPPATPPPDSGPGPSHG